MWISSLASEVDAVDLVDDVAQQVAADHAVDDAPEHGGDDVAPVAAVGALQAAQVGEEARALGAVGADGFLLVDEGEQFVAGDAVGRWRPSRASGRAARWPGGTSCRPAWPRSPRICSMSSRNFRNMIQVSIGSRSRSPLSPLSFRMMSRHDFTIEESRWAVVNGWEFLDLVPRAITS